MSGKNILIISSEFPPGPGGIGKHAYDLARTLIKKGSTVTVLTSQDYASPDDINKFNRESGELKIIPFIRSGVGSYFKRWKLAKKIIENQKPELIITSGRFPLWLGGMIKRKYKDAFQVRAMVHGSELTADKPLFLKLTRYFSKFPDEVWAVSEHTKNHLKSLFNNREIKILPNGLRFEDWDPYKSKTDKSHDTKNIKLLTVGRISSRKGQQRVVRALPELLKKFPGLTYIVAGIDDKKEELLNLASQLNVKDQIIITGKLPGKKELADVYKECDIFIMLSETQPSGDTEGFGIAILEANFFGIPAVGAAGCGIEDAIRNEYNGILTDGNDVKAITQAVTKIVGDYSNYSENAREWAAQHNWDAITDKYKF